MIFNNKTILVIAIIVIFIISLVLTINNSMRPFGYYFWFPFMTTLISLALLFGSLSYRYWKRRSFILGTLFLGLFISLSLSPLLLHKLVFGNLSINNQLTDSQWQEDLDFLVDTVMTIHPQVDSLKNKEPFIRSAKILKGSLNTLTTNQKIIAFNRLIATLNDGHSSIWPLFSPANFQSYPIKTYDFPGGLYIMDASNKYKEHIGSKIVGVGDYEINEVREKIYSITGAENSAGKQVRLSMYLPMAELLEAEGITSSSKFAVFHLQKPNLEKYSIRMTPEPGNMWMFWSFYRPIASNFPSTVQNVRTSFYNYQYDSSNKSLYFQFNIVQDKLLFGESIEEITQELEEFIENNEINKFVIDLRNNNGGNGQLLHPLVDMIALNNKIIQRGKLFTIIGRYTFSAASLFAMALENRTYSLFVGEPMGASPNFYGDAITQYLPHSKLEVLISTRYWENSFALDKRHSIIPDLPVTYTYSDYQKGIDSSIQAINNYSSKNIKYNSISNSRGLDGRYKISPTSIAIIALKNNALMLTITDFSTIGFSLYESVLSASENTNILLTKDTEINLITASNQIILNWRGRNIQLEPMLKEETVVLELIVNKQYKEAINSIMSGAQVPLHINREALIMNIANYFTDEDLKLAITIYKFSTQEYPHSSNAYFNLAEAYLTANTLNLAKSNYMKVLELDPSNENAKASLQSIIK